MSKAKELQTTTKLVKQILQNCPESRNSDNILYVKVCEELGKANGIDINTMSMPHFLMHLKSYNMPGFETVRRTRQKLQAAFPELAGCDEVEAQRVLNEEVYRDYARQVSV